MAVLAYEDAARPCEVALWAIDLGPSGGDRIEAQSSAAAGPGSPRLSTDELERIMEMVAQNLAAAGVGDSAGQPPKRSVGARSATRWLPVRPMRHQPLEEARLAWPCLDEHVVRDLACCVAESERDDHYVVQRTDHRKELGDEVDRRQNPQGREPDGDLDRGTRGSHLSRLAVVTQSGNTDARSLAVPGGRRRANTTIADQVRTIRPTPTSSRPPPVLTAPD